MCVSVCVTHTYTHTHIHTFPVRADFNEARFVVNRTLEGLTRDLTHILYWRHRSIRGAAQFAAKQW